MVGRLDRRSQSAVSLCMSRCLLCLSSAVRLHRQRPLRAKPPLLLSFSVAVCTCLCVRVRPSISLFVCRLSCLSPSIFSLHTEVRKSAYPPFAVCTPARLLSASRSAREEASRLSAEGKRARRFCLLLLSSCLHVFPRTFLTSASFSSWTRERLHISDVVRTRLPSSV